MNVISELEAHDAILHDQHIVLKSGRHGSDYINLDFMFPHMKFMQQLGGRIAESIYSHMLNHGIDALVAPAVGGVALLQWVGFNLRAFSGDEPLLFWADRDGDDFIFERAKWRHDLKDLRVAGVEDIVTTGGSLKKTLNAAREAGASPEMAVAVCLRGSATAKSLGVPYFEALTTVEYPDYESGPDSCPMCRDQVPIAQDVGHGDLFKVHHPDYPGGYIKLLG